MLDQQVVRAALKAFNAVAIAKTAPPSALTPSSAYLRRLSAPPTAAPERWEWAQPATAVALLERRAAVLVQERAARAADPDAGMDTRVARAVADAFVAARVGEMVEALEGPNARVLRMLYLLVRRAV